MGIMVFGIGLIEFILMFGYPPNVPLWILSLNVTFGILGVVVGIIMMKKGD